MLNRICTCFVFYALLLCFGGGFVQNENCNFRKNLVTKCSRSSNSEPISVKQNVHHERTSQLSTFLGISAFCSTLRPYSAKAMGTIPEFNDFPMVLQDIAFNVQDSKVESNMLSKLLQDRCRTIRVEKNGEEIVTFGAEDYKSPKTFYPGISPFSEDGGHASITFKQLNAHEDGTTEVVDNGEGLQYLRLGVEELRISKGIQAGADIRYAYGWVDLDSPSKVPFEVVVGIARDPIMFACLKVSNMEKSISFFRDVLGMSVRPIPLARTIGSQYEKQQNKGEFFLSYGDDSFGLLLVPRGPKDKNKGPINVGSLLEEFSILVDDINNTREIPEAARLLINDPNAETLFISPDGYKFRLRKYSNFVKFASQRWQ